MINVYNEPFCFKGKHGGGVDLFICDLPSGKTKEEWDKKLDLHQFWVDAKRYSHNNTCFLFFATPPFNFELYASNPKQYRYSWIWRKNNAAGGMNANRRPLRDYEEIMVFYNKLPVFNPQKRKGRVNNETSSGEWQKSNVTSSGGFTRQPSDRSGMKYPRQVIEFSKVPPSNIVHPSQKPVALLEYLIKTYTNDNGVVLDPTMGVGSTAVAAIKTKRFFVGFEQDVEFFNKAKVKISKDIQLTLI